MPKQRRPRSPAQVAAFQRMQIANRQRRARVGRQRRSPRRTRTQPQPHARARGYRRTIRLSAPQMRAYRSGRIIRPRMAEWDAPIRW